MDSYDSDSSLEGDSDYTETNVNLGYASKEPTGDTVSHLGGFPTWLDSTIQPAASFARCKVCSSPMSLLLQLNGDLPEEFPHDERRLHVFTCRRKPCSRQLGGIRVLREVRKYKAERGQENEKLPAKSLPLEKPNDLGATLFGATSSKPELSNANPFSKPTQAQSSRPSPFSSTSSTSNLAAKPPQRIEDPPTETFASKLRMSSSPPQPKHEAPTEPWPSETMFPNPFPYLFLDADYETLLPAKSPIRDAASSKVEFEEEGGGAHNTSDQDAFESSLDKTFLKFSDRLAHNPEQVLRYEWKGTPLLYSSIDEVGKRLSSSNAKTKPSTRMPRCESCGSERLFEVQLVPGAIAALEEREVSLDGGMEWGTIIVGVCGQNCGEVGEVIFREEWCGVQWEERG